MENKEESSCPAESTGSEDKKLNTSPAPPAPVEPLAKPAPPSTNSLPENGQVEQTPPLSPPPAKPAPLLKEDKKIEPIDQPASPTPSSLPLQENPSANAQDSLQKDGQAEQTAKDFKPAAEPPLEAAEEKVKSTSLPEEKAEAKIKPPAPAPASPPLPLAAESAPLAEPADTFLVRFKNKLKDLLIIARKKRHSRIEKNEKIIMDFARKHNRIDNKNVREITGLSDERARFYLNKLEQEKKLVQMGSKGPKVFYMPIGK